jgi:probable phosphoglycerate mutase
VTLRITLVRHGRSEANEANLWQGQGDSPLSATGSGQAAALGARLEGTHFDLVVASDLERAADTARAVSTRVETDPAWREMDLGEWEGRTFEEVAARHPDLLEAIRNGEAIAFGETGETLADFELRARGALEALIERIGPDGSALVATHGGIIDAIVGGYLGRVPGRRTVPVVTNTSVTVLAGKPGRVQLRTLNDATHLGIDVGFLGRMRSDGVPVVAFVRHGLTDANKEGRIQGQSCWGLSVEGEEQARVLSAWYPTPGRVISSPLERAMATAAAFGLPVETDDALKELAFGAWEGMLGRDVGTLAEAKRIFEHHEDLPRGGHGETFAEVTTRMSAFLEGLDLDSAGPTVVVTHGASIRALVAGLHHRGNDINRDLGVAPNASVTHVALTPDGPVLADYALTPGEASL